MSKWIKYVGPHDAVDVPRWQIGGAVRDEPVEVSDEAEADLLTQPDNWAKASRPRQSDSAPAGAGQEG